MGVGRPTLGQCSFGPLGEEGDGVRGGGSERGRIDRLNAGSNHARRELPLQSRLLLLSSAPRSHLPMAIVSPLAHARRIWTTRAQVCPHAGRAAWTMAARRDGLTMLCARASWSCVTSAAICTSDSCRQQSAARPRVLHVHHEVDNRNVNFAAANASTRTRS